ncbi:4-hydroxy-tetrahydrodipicolinate synthase [Mycolicibacterium litorale]|uniref:4-hydroxy-tetrahydrodipicolinate synthase n=2 Tax=Mycolicibacterium litorale TaxID=758802 RepID=A0A6S6P4K3_9MYCO|nr:4-hydroxy-tetrahydrodipicolinate synthase [Mycolicibacterium litorale]
MAQHSKAVTHMGLFDAPGMWKGVLCAPLTPFTSDLAFVDDDRFAQQIDFLIGQGVPALSPGLHAGESPSLSAGERDLLMRLTVEVADGRVPVVAHVSSSATRQSVEHAQTAAAAGAAAVVSASPYYWQPTDGALIDHFAAIAEAVDVPLIPYVYPGDLTLDSFAALLDALPTAGGIKSGDFDLQYLTELCRIVADRRPDFSVFAGVEYALPMAVLGGAGCFSALGLVAPRLVAALSAAVEAGDVVAALPLQRKMSALWHLLRPGYPGRVKAACTILGRDLGPVRPPVSAPDAAEVNAVERELTALGLTETEGFGWRAAP